MVAARLPRGQRDDSRALLDKLKQDDFVPGLIVIDTLAWVALGADENSARDTGRAVDGLDELKRQILADRRRHL